MEASRFDVDAFVFVETNPSNPRKAKEILVPGALLEFDETHIVVLERQSQRPKPAKNIPILMAVTTDLKDFRVLDCNLPQEPVRIFAHAVASHGMSTTPIDGAGIAYSAGHQFFLVNFLPKELEPAKYDKVEVVNLQTGQVGFVPAAALVFYIHAKVVEEFEWIALNKKKVLNKIGDLLTIAHEIWELSWDPGCKKSGKDPVTFGRNRRTGYSGLVRVQAIAELEPEELESWRRSNLFPVWSPGPHYSRNRAPPSPVSPSPISSPQSAHSDREVCSCWENIDPVAEYKRNNPTPGWRSNSNDKPTVTYFTDWRH